MVVLAGLGYRWLQAGMPVPAWLGAYEGTSLVRENEQVVRAVVALRDSLPAKELHGLLHVRLRLPRNAGWELAPDSKPLLEHGPVLLTVESWGSRQWNAYNNNPLIDIAEGRYDESIVHLCRQLPRQGIGVFVRLNPDMEVPGSRYPWQQYPEIYISAFQRFADLVRKYAPEAHLVWAPAGYPGAMEFYPGDAYVDAASVTVRSRTEAALTAYPIYEEVEYELFRRIHRLRTLDVPIFVLGEGRSVVDSLSSGVLQAVGDRIASARSLGYEAGQFVGSLGEEEDTGASEDLLVGLYDPMEHLLNEPGIRVEHLFVDFEKLHGGQFSESFSEVIGRGHRPIVTFEPFNLPNGDSDGDVLRQVTEGRYDDYIRELYRILASTKMRVYLRYAHEMEIPIHRYPWQSKDPLEYIESFRYFMRGDTVSDNILQVWGPAGDRGSEEWYPGDDWVDYVSIAIYGLPDKNITDPKQQESFARIFDRKMWRMRFIDKPVFITEFGVKGPEDYQTDWMLDAARVLRDDPRIFGVNYFNMSDTPSAWGDIKPPDWSITHATLDTFVAALQEK